MRADEQFDNLYHVASCHSESCFALDLEFDSPSGLPASWYMPTVLGDCLYVMGRGGGGAAMARECQVD